MDKQALFKALDGFKMYETGATDAGIHDPDLRVQVFGYLKGLPEAERDALLHEWTEVFVGDDVEEACDWLNQNNILPRDMRALLD